MIASPLSYNVFIMGRKALVGAEEKILTATILIGGAQTGDSSFSTKEVALSAGISEYVIFSHYKNKDNLQAKALLFCHEKIEQAWRGYLAQGMGFQEFTLANEHFFVENAPVRGYLLAYSRLCPRLGARLLGAEEDPPIVQSEIALFSTFLKTVSPKEAAFLYKAFIRNVLYSAELLSKSGTTHKAWDDATKLTLEGLTPYRAKETGNYGR